MSAFGFYQKDNIVDAIKEFISFLYSENKPDIQINYIIKETMEAVNYGLELGIWEIENK